MQQIGRVQNSLSPQHPSLLKRNKSESVLDSRKSKTTATDYNLNKQKPNRNKVGRQPKMQIPNEETELLLSSEIQQNRQFLEEYYPPIMSELNRKRVSFGQSEYCFAKPNRIRMRVVEQQRRSSILKMSQRSSRSSSVLSLGSSKEKISIDKGKESAAISLINKYRKIFTDFQQKRKEMKDILYKGEKYTDTLFPPIASSAFSLKQAKQSKLATQEVTWKRIPEVFKGRKLRLKKEAGEESSIQIRKGKYGAAFLADSLQAVKNIDDLLEWMLHESTYNNYGVYILRIFQNNVPKSIIIDDFVPVIKNEKSEWIPAFTTIHDVDIQGKNQSLQIWPLLVEKAYASYYNSYAALKTGNLIDFVEEITGCFFSAADLRRLQKLSLERNAIAIEQTTKNNALGWIPAYLPAAHKKGFAKSEVKFQILNYTLPNVMISKVIALKDGPKMRKVQLHLKKIAVKEGVGRVSVMIRQKDKRFYSQSIGSYEYIWIRVILLINQYEGNYRWIDGLYSNEKSINMNVHMEAGEYYLLVMPEWKQTHRHQISVVFNAESDSLLTCLNVSSQAYDDSKRMLERGCADLAQRKGFLQQFNKVLCSYNYVCKKAGLIIENVHNERLGGQIAIQRTWKCGGQLLTPFNKEFAGGQRKRVEVVIPVEGEYTWVILCLGGLHTRQLQQFRFQ